MAMDTLQMFHYQRSSYFILLTVVARSAKGVKSPNRAIQRNNFLLILWPHWFGCTVDIDMK